METAATPLRVLITGAAGQIGYSLVPLVANGYVFGPNQPVILHLLDIERAAKMLNGVAMELEDGAYPLVHSYIATTDVQKAFKDVDYAVMVGGFPRLKGMERKDLLKKNGPIFKGMGEGLKLASKNVKCLVVANPANTNCLIAMKHSGLPAKQFSALTRLDQNRASSQIALKLGVPVSAIKGVVIWGNHSGTQFPDASKATANGKPLDAETLKWTQTDEFITKVRKRGAAIIAERGLSSAMSAANATANHLRDWHLGSDAPISMAVASDKSYDVPEGIIYSFPVTCKDGEYQIVKDWGISEFSKPFLEATAKELCEERDIALA